MRHARLLALSASLLTLSAAAPGEQEPVPEAVRQAPDVAAPDAPPEAALEPRPEEEKTQPAPGVVEIRNPAFPGPAPQKPVVHRGRRYDVADLSPYFAEGVLAEAKAAFDKGLYRQARTLLDGVSNPTPPVRYLKGLAAIRGGLAQLAADEMQALAEDYPAMKDRCLTHAALALEDLARWEDAAALFAQVPESSRLYPDARLGLARTLRRAGNYEGARAALESLATRGTPGYGRDVAAESLMSLAEMSASKKDGKAEREYLLRLWAEHPLSALARSAESRLRAKGFTLEARVSRAESLIELHRNEAGLKILEPLLKDLKLPDPVACQGRFVYGKGLRKQREHTKAAAILGEVVDQCQSPDLRSRAMYVLGSSRSIIDPTRGTQTYDQLAREFPNHSFADDALFYAADLYVKLGQTDEAVVRLEELTKLYPAGDFAGEAYFKTFWIHRTRGDLAKAIQVLDGIEARFADEPESYDLERAKYWRARMHADAGEKAQAVALFQRLAVDHPATYYGLMARNQLLVVAPESAEAIAPELAFPREAASPWPLFAGPLGEDPHFLAAVELLRLGFPDSVSSELLAANRSHAPAEGVRLLVQMLALTGDARAAHALARISLRADLSGRITASTRSTWEIAYPNAFRELIEKHCETAQIEPDLLQALMREESALDPRALSWAGALGLTQLMPATAKAVAREIKLKSPGKEDLLEPDLNIRLGSWYLGGLVRRWDGNLAYAIASYNAGPGAVSRWRNERPDVPLDAWVEEIPIAETRGYVKRVLRSYNTYQLLYGRAPSLKAITVSGR